MATHKVLHFLFSLKVMFHMWSVFSFSYTSLLWISSNRSLLTHFKTDWQLTIGTDDLLVLCLPSMVQIDGSLSKRGASSKNVCLCWWAPHFTADYTLNYTRSIAQHSSPLSQISLCCRNKSSTKLPLLQSADRAPRSACICNSNPLFILSQGTESPKLFRDPVYSNGIQAHLRLYTSWVSVQSSLDSRQGVRNFCPI
jgi:hypothetical protein